MKPEVGLQEFTYFTPAAKVLLVPRTTIELFQITISKCT